MLRAKAAAADDVQRGPLLGWMLNVWDVFAAALGWLFNVITLGGIGSYGGFAGPLFSITLGRHPLLRWLGSVFPTDGVGVMVCGIACFAATHGWSSVMLLERDGYLVEDSTGVQFWYQDGIVQTDAPTETVLTAAAAFNSSTIAAENCFAIKRAARIRGLFGRNGSLVARMVNVSSVEDDPVGMICSSNATGVTYARLSDNRAINWASFWSTVSMLLGLAGMIIMHLVYSERISPKHHLKWYRILLLIYASAILNTLLTFTLQEPFIHNFFWWPTLVNIFALFQCNHVAARTPPHALRSASTLL